MCTFNRIILGSSYGIMQEFSLMCHTGIAQGTQYLPNEHLKLEISQSWHSSLVIVIHFYKYMIRIRSAILIDVVLLAFCVLHYRNRGSVFVLQMFVEHY